MSQCASDHELEEAFSERYSDVQGLVRWALAAMASACDAPELHSVDAHNEQRRRWAEVLGEHLRQNGW